MVGWTQAYDENSFGAVYADYMNLFIGPGKPLAPPWESIYDCSDEGLVFQRGTLEVRKAYLSFGLQIEEMHHEPDDHIGYELEFVSRLSRLTAEALQRGDVKEAERVLFEQTNFLEKHVFSWVFDWCELVCAHATTDFYRGIAMLIRGFLREAGSVRDVGLPEKALTL
ncbi:MAG: molecular chaperone TorD family protein [Gordonibacter sp.]|uniref:TorD/DmsD family molecular chaperone n=1 Tax=Gordonibacter sp. TaxID=1968902 RepID=UPI002FC95D72